MEKITKKEAKALFNSGLGVTFTPSKCNPQSFLAVRMYKTEIENDFVMRVNHFQYYNCSKVAGKVVHFYK